MGTASHAHRGVAPHGPTHGSAFFMGLAAVALALPVCLRASQAPVVTAITQMAMVAALGLALCAWALRPWTPPTAGPAPQADAWWGPVLMAALLGSSLFSALVGVLQVLAPAGVHTALFEASTLPGRAVGHLRQPNHLATWLCWGGVALVAVVEGSRQRPHPAALWLGLGLLVGGVVLSGSRTGWLGLGLWVGWAALDRRLHRHSRWALAATPAWALAWGLGASAWTRWQHLPYGAAQRLAETTAGADLSSSRTAIWSNTWDLILQHPLTGVGWGQFNLAWTLTPFPHRPLAFFDHSHNLLLQAWVVWGLPLGTALLLLGAAALAWAGWRAWRDDGPHGGWRRAAWVLCVMVLLHSLLEYPLWYAHFLIPAVLAWGVAGVGPLKAGGPLGGPVGRGLAGLAGGLTLVGAAALYLDYQSIRAIYAPSPGAAPLAQRLAQGQQAWWFAKHAHYAVATLHKPVPGQAWPQEVAQAFAVAPEVLLDARLMGAWARALEARNGPTDRDRARHLAARLREFKDPLNRAWLSACEHPSATTVPSVACEAPERHWTWRELLEPPPGRSGSSGP